ncbi:MAG TPA: GAF domain-containing protein, partial [Thermoanaerobaculia bacterium]
MQSPPIPLDEARRLSAVRELALLDTPAEERFDRITRLALRLFEVSSATIALVDETREWIKSSAGFAHPQLAREVSFAAHAIGQGDLLVVEDTVRDARFHNHPLVLGDPRVRFYAGQPLHAEDASLAGALS